MTIGSITVDLLAKTGSFETDFNRSAKLAAKRAKEIDDAVSKAGAAVGASLVAAGTAAVYFGKQLIDGLDALNDYKDATGASIENLSALEDVAGRTGANMDTVSGILVKFNNVLKEADGKNGVSQALKAIGLNAEELKRLDPAEALRVTAVALSQFADDGNKARLVQELFGKSIKEAAPFLADLAQQTALVGKVTSEQTQAAEDFNKQLFALQKNAVDAGRALISDLLPMVMRLTQEFTIGQKTAGGFLDALITFGTINPFRSQQGNLKALRSEIEGLEGDRARYTRSGSDTRAIDDAIRNSKKQYEYLKALQQRDALADTGDTSDAVSRRFLRAPAALPSVGNLPTAPKDAKTPKESEFQKYLENLGKQLDKAKELTVAETVLADIRSGRLKLGKGESQEVLLAVARQVDAAKSLAEYTKLSADAERERSDALLKTALEQEGQAKTLTDGNKSMRDEIELIGKSVEAQAAIEKARITSAIAIKEEEFARLQGGNALIRETDAITAQIKLLKERQDLVGMKAVADRLKADADEAKHFAQQVGAAFESSFEKAILSGDKLSDVLRGLVKDVAALYIRNEITGPLAKSFGSAGGFDLGGLVSRALGLGGYSAADQAGLDGLIAGLDRRAAGGPVNGGQTYVVGELGPELFTPRTSGAIVPNHALSGGGQVNVTIHNTVGDVATVSMLREAQAGTEQRIAGALSRSQRYGGALS